MGGFALLEMCVVLLLLSVVAASAVLDLPSLRRRVHLDGAARRVAADLRLARIRAASLGTNYRILFRPGSRDYLRQRREEGSYRDDGSAVELPAGIRCLACTAPNGAIGFRPRGTPSEFGTVTLADDENRQRRIVVDATGGVRVE